MSNLDQNLNENQSQDNENLALWLKILSLYPIVGVILYFVNKNKAPKKAKTAGYLALIGSVVIVILQIAVRFLGHFPPYF